LESTVLPQAESKGNTRSMLASLGLCLREYSTFLTVGFFFVQNHFFRKKLTATKKAHQCRIIRFLKVSILKRSFNRPCRVWQTLPSYTKSNVKTAQARTPVSAPVTLYTDTRRPVSSYCAGLKLNSLIQSHIKLLLHLRLSTLSVPCRRQCHLAIRYGGGGGETPPPPRKALLFCFWEKNPHLFFTIY